MKKKRRRAKKSAPKKRAAHKAPDARVDRRASGPGRLIADLERQGVTRAKIGGFDIDGILRGKYVSLKKLRSALDKGFGFCDVIFGWDVADALYDNAKVTGWHTGYPDAHAVLDPSTMRLIPWEPGVVAMLCDFRDEKGDPHPACPRSLLKRVVARARAMGFEPTFGAEFEFFLFKETPDTLHEKRFRDLAPLDPGMYGYSWVREGQSTELMAAVMEGLREFDIELEGLHTETGPGVYEAAIGYDEAVRAADKAALFKTAMKQIAHQHGLSVTFMAKCNQELPGASGHLHQSLGKNGVNQFYDARAKHGMSLTMKRYIAGQMELMKPLTAIYSPTINAYKRYVPGLWAPLTASWGVENRTCAIRVVAPGDPRGLRVEYRQTAADINPYLAMAACLAAGLHGIEHRLKLPPEVSGEASAEGPDKLPTTLKDANAALAASRPARQILGADFVDHYVRSRDWEVRSYERAVTDWELERYFEAV